MARFSVGTGGTSLIEDYHSDGSAGKLDFLLVIWWNAPASTYQVFTCSNGSDNAGQLRGSAHWERATLVNDYVEKLNDKDQKCQDRFSDLTPAAFTLVAGIERNGKTFLPLITTTYRRKVNSYCSITSRLMSSKAGTWLSRLPAALVRLMMFVMICPRTTGLAGVLLTICDCCSLIK